MIKQRINLIRRSRRKIGTRKAISCMIAPQTSKTVSMVEASLAEESILTPSMCMNGPPNQQCRARIRARQKLLHAKARQEQVHLTISKPRSSFRRCDHLIRRVEGHEAG